jgi:hypothetical protein
MSEKKFINMRFEVHTFIDEDYDENDRPIGVEVIDGIELNSFTTNLPEKLVRQLGNYIQHSSSGNYYMTEFLPDFLRGNPPTDA